ncbi:MAG: STAS domain-containing protein [Mycobacteriales bacterium]
MEVHTQQPPVAFDVEEREPQRVMITVHGELDVLSNQRLRDAFRGLEDRRQLRVVVNLQEARLRDSCALVTLLAAGRRIAARGGSLTLDAVTPPTAQALSRTGLARMFSIEVA